VTLVGSPGTIRGSVVLDSRLAPPEAVRQVDVALLHPGDEELEPAAATNPDARGVFVIHQVAPGPYVLLVRYDGFRTQRIPVDVEFGRVNDVGSVALEQVEVRVRIEGTALLGGRATHGDIRVRLQDTELESTTDPDGAYTLFAPLRARRWTLEFTQAGYEPAEAEVVAPADEVVTAALAAAEEDADVVIPITPEPAQVRLQPYPGRIRGSVRLPLGFEDPVLLQQVAVRIYQADPEDFSAAEVAVDGSYVFEGVAPGDWVLSFSLEGFQPRSELVRVDPGEDTLVAPRVISPDLDASRSFLEGVARRACEGECDHGGIRVEVVNTPFVAQTASTGRYRLELVARENYTLQFSAPGYESVQVADVDAVEDEINAVEDVTLPARPGTIRAVVSLRRHGTPARLAAVDVSLWSAAGGTRPCGRCDPTPRERWSSTACSRVSTRSGRSPPAT